jgi:hypothetical protein
MRIIAILLIFLIGLLTSVIGKIPNPYKVLGIQQDAT